MSPNLIVGNLSNKAFFNRQKLNSKKLTHQAEKTIRHSDLRSGSKNLQLVNGEGDVLLSFLIEKSTADHSELIIKRFQATNSRIRFFAQGQFGKTSIEATGDIESIVQTLYHPILTITNDMGQTLLVIHLQKDSTNGFRNVNFNWPNNSYRLEFPNVAQLNNTSLSKGTTYLAQQASSKASLDSGNTTFSPLDDFNPPVPKRTLEIKPASVPHSVDSITMDQAFTVFGGVDKPVYETLGKGGLFTYRDYGGKTIAIVPRLPERFSSLDELIQQGTRYIFLPSLVKREMLNGFFFQDLFQQLRQDSGSPLLPNSLSKLCLYGGLKYPSIIQTNDGLYRCTIGKDGKVTILNRNSTPIGHSMKLAPNKLTSVNGFLHNLALKLGHTVNESASIPPVFIASQGQTLQIQTNMQSLQTSKRNGLYFYDESIRLQKQLNVEELHQLDGGVNCRFNWPLRSLTICKRTDSGKALPLARIHHDTNGNAAIRASVNFFRELELS